MMMVMTDESGEMWEEAVVRSWHLPTYSWEQL